MLFYELIFAILKGYQSAVGETEMLKDDCK